MHNNGRYGRLRSNIVGNRKQNRVDEIVDEAVMSHEADEPMRHGLLHHIIWIAGFRRIRRSAGPRAPSHHGRQELGLGGGGGGT